MPNSAVSSTIGKILKSLLIIIILNPENYCIPHRYRLLSQTTNQLLNNFEPKNLENILNLEG